ncbi:MAG: TlpA family protein disulfide reductase, partial [Candidatus Marinimicrobia bacterium]|nr:TlpA family protein disulfide reductase [Candidatus Neomarinimicrobiota bacterium]
STWCEPCIEEFPYVVGLEKKYDVNDLDVIFFSVDWDEQSKEARSFLKDQQVMGKHYRKREGDDQLFINAFSTEWTGAIPFTVLYDRNGELLAQWEGKRSESYFYAKIDSLLTLFGS